MSGYAPEVHPIHIQLDRLLADFSRIALFFRFGRIFSLAVSTPIASAACLRPTVFPLFRVSSAVGTCVHAPILPRPSLLDTPTLSQRTVETYILVGNKIFQQIFSSRISRKAGC